MNTTPDLDAALEDLGKILKHVKSGAYPTADFKWLCEHGLRGDVAEYLSLLCAFDAKHGETIQRELRTLSTLRKAEKVQAALNLTDDEILAANALAAEIAFECRDGKSAGQHLITLAKVGLAIRAAAPTDYLQNMEGGK